jgi:hypothetical protein
MPTRMSVQQGDFRPSILIVMPSVDIDCDSDNTATPTWHGIDRSDWEEYIENKEGLPRQAAALQQQRERDSRLCPKKGYGS